MSTETNKSTKSDHDSRHTPPPSAQLPFTAAMATMQKEWWRMADESTKAMEVSFAEADRALTEAFRLAQANMHAARELSRSMLEGAKTLR
jgi:hypothetical protein